MPALNICDPGVRSGSPEEERRSASDFNLPWTVIVTDADSAAETDRMATSLVAFPDWPRSCWFLAAPVTW